MSRMSASALVAQPLVQRWAVASGALVAVALVLAALFPDEAAGALHVWLTSTAYNHCFLILPVALYLAWDRREVFAALAPRPDPRPLALIVPLSLLWLVAARLSVLEAQQFLIMAMFELAALSIVGLAAFRALLTPFLYLFFLVPSGYFLVPYLQDFTADFIVRGLEFLHIPVFSDGTFIEVPSGNFVVAEACAGLRFLVASIAFGVLYATLVYRSRVRRLIFVALSIIVPIIANGLRGLGLIVISEFFGSKNAVMTDHILYGWLFFSLVTALLIAIGMTFSDAHRAPVASAVALEVEGARPMRLWAVAAMGIILAAMGPAYAQFRELSPPPVPDTIAAPAVSAPWQPTPAATALWEPRLTAPDRVFRDTFGNGSATVMRYVALYRIGGLHDNLVRAVNEVADPALWNTTARATAKVQIAGRSVTVASTEFERNGQRLLVWSFYALDGRILASPFAAKIAELEGLVGRRSLAAFVAVATEETAGPDAARQTLQNFLEAMAPLDYGRR